MEFDFAAKDDVEYAEIMAPDDAPAALPRSPDPVERGGEGGGAARTPFPRGSCCSPCRTNWISSSAASWSGTSSLSISSARGMIADIAMHRPGKEGDQRNFHAHILVTTRRLDRTVFGRKDRAWRTPATGPRMARWAGPKIQNEHLRRHLGPDAPAGLPSEPRRAGHRPHADRAPGARGDGHGAQERAHRSGRAQPGCPARNDAAQTGSRRDYSATADRLAAAAPEVEAPIDKLVPEAARVREGLVAERAAWEAERPALRARGRQPEGDRAGPAGARCGARGAARGSRLRAAEDRVASVREPAAAAGGLDPQSGADDLGQARRTQRPGRAREEVRRSGAAPRDPPGLAALAGGPGAGRGAPPTGLDQAAEAARKRRTLVRKIKRMDRRIDAATRTLSDLEVAQELGQRQLRVPSHSPDATRFIRDVGAPARAAIARYPAPARQPGHRAAEPGPGALDRPKPCSPAARSRP